MNRLLALSALALTLAFPKTASADLIESFNDISALPGLGWSLQNNSSPLGSTNWFQGNIAVFDSQAGPANSYLAANFLNAAGQGTISNWALTPVQTFSNGDTISFWTRTATPGATVFPDRLQVRLSTSGSSTDVGTTATSVGDFTTLLLDINAGYTTSGYPTGWTEFTIPLSGLSGPTTGRVGFRYFVTNTATNGNYIGIDTLTITTSGQVGGDPAATPEPATLAVFGVLAAGAFGVRRRVRAKAAA